MPTDPPKSPPTGEALATALLEGAADRQYDPDDPLEPPWFGATIDDMVTETELIKKAVARGEGFTLSPQALAQMYYSTCVLSAARVVLSGSVFAGNPAITQLWTLADLLCRDNVRDLRTGKARPEHTDLVHKMAEKVREREAKRKKEN